jgi:hypothetical protein
MGLSVARPLPTQDSTPQNSGHTIHPSSAIRTQDVSASLANTETLHNAAAVIAGSLFFDSRVCLQAFFKVPYCIKWTANRYLERRDKNGIGARGVSVQLFRARCVRPSRALKTLTDRNKQHHSLARCLPASRFTLEELLNAGDQHTEFTDPM